MKMDRKNIFFVLCVLISGIPAISQVGVQRPIEREKSEEIKKRTLLVVLFEESEKELEPIKKDENKYKIYLTQVKDINERFKDVINKFWTFNNDIIFTDLAGAIKRIEENPQKYAIVQLEMLGVGLRNNILFRASNYVLRISIDLAESINYRKPLFYQTLQGNFDENLSPIVPTRDIIFGTQFIQNHLEQVLITGGYTWWHDIKKNHGALAKKTLLIDKEYLSKGINEQIIKENYEFLFKIVDANTITKYQMEKNPDYAYVVLIETIAEYNNTNLHYVVSCENGKILSSSDMGPTHSEPLIDAKHLKTYAKRSQPKEKRKKRTKN